MEEEQHRKALLVLDGFLHVFDACRLCPRECGVNRREKGKGALSGFCRESERVRVGYIGPHFGEEPPITGTHGSGTIFFSGCSLRCSYCQNHQISRGGLGRTMDMAEILKSAKDMLDHRQVHNINFVTPDHFFPYAFSLVSILRTEGYPFPALYNLSGYQSLDLLRIAEQYADIYLPDFKYSDARLSTQFSSCRDYPKVALEAVCEMVRQKGFLDSTRTGAPLATRGVLVRHLILPGRVQNSIDALNTLFLEFGAGLPLSLMSQYAPVVPHADPNMNRPVSKEEFERVYAHALELGFLHMFVQFPDDRLAEQPSNSPFLPDFQEDEPFSKD